MLERVKITSVKSVPRNDYTAEAEENDCTLDFVAAAVISSMRTTPTIEVSIGCESRGRIVATGKGETIFRSEYHCAQNTKRRRQIFLFAI